MICKKGNAMQKICMAGIVMGAVLLLAGCGDGRENEAKGREPGAIEIWDGAKADLENGRRVKKADYVYTDYVYTDPPFLYSITYDVGGRITSVTGKRDGTHSGMTFTSLPDAFERVLNLDGALYEFVHENEYTSYMEKRFFRYEEGEYNPDLRKMNIKNIKEYSFAENGAVLSCRHQYSTDSGNVVIEEKYYKYDSKGRLIEKTRYKNNQNDATCLYVYESGEDLLLSKARDADSARYSGYSYYQHSYDSNGNVVKELIYDKEKILIEIIESEYDEDGNLLLSKTTSGYGADSKDYYEVSWIIQYDENGYIESSTHISKGGKEYTSEKTEYLYDEKGRLTEQNKYELMSPASQSELVDWCNSGGNTELYITSKQEFKYDDAPMVRKISYKYEANKDFSQINLTATEEGGWRKLEQLMPGMEGYWIITYYTEEEINQYLHDQEFSPVK